MIIVLALIATLAKDIAYVGLASDIARIGLLGVAGVTSLPGAQRAAWKAGLASYWPIVGYLFACIVPLLYVTDPLFVLFHIVSIVCALLIGMAIAGAPPERRERLLRRLFVTTIVLVSIGCLASLAVAAVDPARAWEHPQGDVRRFRGVFSKPAMLGMTSALMAGFALFHLKSAWLKWPLVLLAAVCILLSGSRAPALAAILALLAVAFHYGRLRGRRLVAVGVALAVVVGGLAALSPRMPVDALRAATRLQSLDNLSGRSELWERVLKATSKQPLFGHGLTMGSQELLRGTAAARGATLGGVSYGKVERRQVARATAHNGYLQALLDSGFVGLFFYVAIVALAAWRIFTRDPERRYAGVTFVLLFMVIVNLAENAIQSASVLQSLIYWIFVGFAFSLPRRGA